MYYIALIKVEIYGFFKIMSNKKKFKKYLENKSNIENASSLLAPSDGNFCLFIYLFFQNIDSRPLLKIDTQNFGNSLKVNSNLTGSDLKLSNNNNSPISPALR